SPLRPLPLRRALGGGALGAPDPKHLAQAGARGRAFPAFALLEGGRVLRAAASARGALGRGARARAPDAGARFRPAPRRAAPLRSVPPRGPGRPGRPFGLA